MTTPNIERTERNLREVFWSGDRDLAVQVARLSVLFEDLRLESTAARHREPLPPLDAIGKSFRYFYFLRRLLVTLDEFAGALSQINANAGWKRIRRGFDRDCERRWDAAVKYFSHNRPHWSHLRNEIGGHFKESAAKFALEHLRESAIGSIEIVMDHKSRTGGIRLLYVEEIVAANWTRETEVGKRTDDVVRRSAHELFTVLMTAANEAVKAMHVVALAYVVDRFRDDPGARRPRRR